MGGRYWCRIGTASHISAMMWNHFTIDYIDCSSSAYKKIAWNLLKTHCTLTQEVQYQCAPWLLLLHPSNNFIHYCAKILPPSLTQVRNLLCYIYGDGNRNNDVMTLVNVSVLLCQCTANVDFYSEVMPVVPVAITMMLFQW